MQSGFVLVAGGGRFGSYAVRTLKSLGVNVIVVDVNPNCLAKKFADVTLHEPIVKVPRGGEVYLIVYDSVQYFIKLLENNIVPRIVAPFVPGHFLGKVTKFYIESKGGIASPNVTVMKDALKKGALGGVTLVADDTQGTIIVSYMPKDLRCRFPCHQPKICPITGRFRKVPMYDLLDRIIGELTNVKVFVSEFINGYIGGVNGKDVAWFLKDVNKLDEVAIATACKCHGIVNFFKIKGLKLPLT